MLICIILDTIQIFKFSGGGGGGEWGDGGENTGPPLEARGGKFQGPHRLYETLVTVQLSHSFLDGGTLVSVGVVVQELQATEVLVEEWVVVTVWVADC